MRTLAFLLFLSCSLSSFAQQRAPARQQQAQQRREGVRTMCADLDDIIAHHMEKTTSDWAEEFPMSHAVFCYGYLPYLDPKYAKQLLDTIEDAWQVLQTEARMRKLLLQAAKADAAKAESDAAERLDEELDRGPWTVHFADSSGVHAYTCILTLDRRARLIHVPSCVPLEP